MELRAMARIDHVALWKKRQHALALARETIV
jgi:hypothetical protein